MGTTLTGTTPQDTYDSLIKVTDNGPLSGTAKYLSDGLGNDSALALSNARVGIGTASPSYKLHVYNPVGTNVASTLLLENAFVGQSATARYKTTVGEFEVGNAISVTANSFEVYDRTNSASRLFISNAGNVGIGTSAPYTSLTIGTSDATAEISSGGPNTHLTLKTVGASGALRFFTIGGGTSTLATTETMRITADGYMRMAASTGGIQFNGDTAAANALDDYEEGTWTMGVSFGGASVGVTYGANTGAYTKIGRKVTVTGYLSISNKGSSTGAALITGLPFAIGTGTQFPAAAPAFFVTVSYTGIPQIVGLSAASVLECFQLSALGSLSALTNSNFANSSEVYVSFTYFV